MNWKLQSLLWKFLPEDRAINLSLVLFGSLLVLSVVVFIVGWMIRRRWIYRVAAGLAVIVLITWGLLFASRPVWLRMATQSVVPKPEVSDLHWESRLPGLQTAELEFRVDGDFVDRMMLVRLDPKHYRLSVHSDPTGTRTAEDWQREFKAAVVVNGSYFDQDFIPLTPLRGSGQPSGPAVYQSTHGALVADGNKVDILDLKGQDVFQAINPFPEAMVSYPLLMGGTGENRAVESRVWLASRNFVALDKEDHVILGTTETGFFTLHRLGEYLRSSPLNLRLALNLDGGPLVSQIVRAGEFTRDFHGKAEITNSSDVLRALWHTYVKTNWTLPIVLLAQPIEP